MSERYQELKFLAGSNLTDVVELLITCKEKGLLVCGNFNGFTLYSDTVTMDKAYIKVTGKTKAEFDKMQQEMKDRAEKLEEEFKGQIPKLIEKWKEQGRKVLTEDKWEQWDNIVPIRLNDFYQGIELGYCLDIVKILNNNGTLDEAKEEIENQNHSGMSYNLVCNMVKDFCERGNEFSDYVR